MYAVIDTETTGLLPSHRHRVIEIAVVLLDARGQVEREWVTLLNPHRDLGPQHIHGILTAVATAAADHPRCEIGMRLSGPVSEEIAATLYRIGFRLFAVDGDEVRPARLAFGKAPAAEPAAAGVA